MKRFLDGVLDRWPAWALFSCALMLGLAHSFETFGHLPPCALCLTQREIYWITGGLAVGVLVVQWKARRFLAMGLWLLAAFFAIEMGVALFHAGVEWKWWTMKACGARGFFGELLDIPRPQMKASDLLDMLSGKAHAVQCDAALWRLPNAPWGLSMAGWNVIIALKLTILSILAARRAR